MANILAAVALLGAVEGAGAELELAREAVKAIWDAGLDPAAEVQVKWVSAAAISFKAQAAIQNAGLGPKLDSIKAAITAHPEVLSGAAPAPAPAGEKPRPEPAPEAPPSEPAPAPGPRAGEGGTPSGHGPPDGFGRNARGASGPVKTVPANAAAIAEALRAGGNVRIESGDVDAPFGRLRIPGHSTVDGGGATLWFPGNSHNGQGVVVAGDDVIVRNLRIRNAGDGLGFGSSATPPSTNVLAENVTVSGSGDDGFSVSYGAKNVTIRWSAALGCTRATFVKYGGATDITLHHNLISHFWMRAPLVSGAGVKVDFRNNVVQHWSMTATQPNDGALVNAVNNTYRFDKTFAPGKADCAISIYQGGSYCSAGNQFLDCSERNQGQKTPVFEAPAIQPEDDAKTSMDKVLSETDGAGCMPRDGVDKAYLSSRERWVAQPGNKGYPVGLQVPGTRPHLK